MSYSKADSIPQEGRGRWRLERRQGDSESWNIHISDKVTAPVIRQTINCGHGNM